MRIPPARLTGGLVVTLGCAAALSLAYAQERPAVPTPGIVPAVATAPADGPDLSRLAPLHQHYYLSARRGAEWLHRANGLQGRFSHGQVPALKAELDGDHLLRQAGAAFALARAARYFREPRYEARAAQAILSLLLTTAADPRDATLRYPVQPSSAVNRLAAAGLLVLAVHELPSPQADLLEQSDGLCNFIRRLQRADGSLRCGDTDGPDDPDAVAQYPGMALAALMRSQQHRPAPWKTDAVRRAAAHYLVWWREHRTPTLVPWHSAAYTEAYLQTKDPSLAAAVLEMNDWLCGLQYREAGPQRTRWEGGFMGWAESRPAETRPGIVSAHYAEGLVDASRVARELPDVARHERYVAALDRCLPFVARLQYTEANTTHFAEWYRPKIVGGFHASEQDGNLRLDQTQYALSALVQYLTQVARVP